MVYRGNLTQGINWARPNSPKWSLYIRNEPKNLYIRAVLLFYSEWATSLRLYRGGGHREMEMRREGGEERDGETGGGEGR